MTSRSAPSHVLAAFAALWLIVAGGGDDSIVVAWSEGTPAQVRVRRGELAGE